jgi:hypothetical protein
MRNIDILISKIKSLNQAFYNKNGYGFCYIYKYDWNVLWSLTDIAAIKRKQQEQYYLYTCEEILEILEKLEVENV